MKYPSIKKSINSDIHLRIDYYNMPERNELEYIYVTMLLKCKNTLLNKKSKLQNDTNNMMTFI